MQTRTLCTPPKRARTNVLSNNKRSPRDVHSSRDVVCPPHHSQHQGDARAAKRPCIHEPAQRGGVPRATGEGVTPGDPAASREDRRTLHRDRTPRAAGASVTSRDPTVARQDIPAPPRYRGADPHEGRGAALEGAVRDHAEGGTADGVQHGLSQQGAVGEQGEAPEFT